MKAFGYRFLMSVTASDSEETSISSDVPSASTSSKKVTPRRGNRTPAVNFSPLTDSGILCPTASGCLMMHLLSLGIFGFGWLGIFDQPQIKTFTKPIDVSEGQTS